MLMRRRERGDRGERSSRENSRNQVHNILKEVILNATAS